MKKIIVIILLMIISDASYSGKTLFDLPKIEQNAEIKADQLFEKGNYQEAFKTYLPLAKLGDKYSQYMVSLQYLNGLGVEKNEMLAYSWANLARKSKTKEVKDYYKQLKQRVNPNNEGEAELLKQEIYSKYSDIAVAKKIERMIRNTIPECTGSRIRGNCAFVKSYCLDSGSLQSYQDCMREVSLMKPKVVRALKQDLAATEKFIELELQKSATVTVSEVKEGKSKKQEQLKDQEERSETEEK